MARSSSRSSALLLACLAAGLALGAGATGKTKKPVWIAVGPPQLTKPLRPLVALRRKQGFDVRVLDGPVRAALKKVPRPDYLLLVGDDVHGAERMPWYLAALRAKPGHREPFESATFATDMLYGDTDGDGVPNFPVGRIPARSPDEVATVVQKIVAYESAPAKPADLRIVAWASTTQLGPTVDSLESSLLSAKMRTLAPDWAGRFLMASVHGDPLCGVPEDEPAVFDAELSRGAIFGAILGHGSDLFVHTMDIGSQWLTYDTRQARRDFAHGSPKAPVVFYTCLCGNFTDPAGCIAGRMLFLPGGPVAAIGATTISHPLTNYYSSVCLLRAIRRGRRRRLGDLWLAAQRKMLSAYDPIVQTAMTEFGGPEGRFEGEPALRKAHVLMYEILGDPATRLRIPGRLEAKVVHGKSGWSWRAAKPEGAKRLVVQLRSPESAEGTKTADDRATPDAVLERANAGRRFVTIATLGRKVAWHGTIRRSGVLRLVAETPNGLRVFAKKLER